MWAETLDLLVIFKGFPQWTFLVPHFTGGKTDTQRVNDPRGQHSGLWNRLFPWKLKWRGVAQCNLTIAHAWLKA
jgi:hypothetical protein